MKRTFSGTGAIGERMCIWCNSTAPCLPVRRNSLQATWIRNAILHAVRQKSPAAAQRIHANVVFQAPTINALADAVLATVHNSSSASSGGNTPEDLVRIAEEYASNLPARPAALRTREKDEDVVLITGTTGGFGCDVLEHLLRDDNVAKVYAFNRRGTQALDRQHARFRERGLDESLLSSSKFVMVEGVLDAPDFGLQAALLDEVLDLRSITMSYVESLTMYDRSVLPSPISCIMVRQFPQFYAAV